MPLIKQHLDGQLLKCVEIAPILTAKDVNFFILPMKSLQSNVHHEQWVRLLLPKILFSIQPSADWVLNTK